jgi:hypothetical protein
VYSLTVILKGLLFDVPVQLQASVVADETLSIRANRTLREVTAVYKKEEACLDIVIRLPSCYPLRAVEVDCTRRLGISETLLRKWILSMASFLRNQVLFQENHCMVHFFQDYELISTFVLFHPLKVRSVWVIISCGLYPQCLVIRWFDVELESKQDAILKLYW